LVSSGRTVTTVSVVMHEGAGSDSSSGAGGRPVAHAVATFAAPDALVDFDAAGPLQAPEVKAFDDGWELPVPKGVEAPLMDTLPLRITGMPDGGFAHTIRTPWSGEGCAAEAAAMMGDYCAGVPVGAAVGPKGTKIPVPNPDLSLRFCGEAWGEVVVGVGRLARIDRGAAATLVEVWTGPDDAWVAGDDRPTLLAVGLSSAVMLAR
ncbi:MAG TPA: hypothetical protein VM618_07125, partial [Acidimicrobiia bacterium]|nr:hypothetical protein [Acidimicrobiia bacterium]